MLLWAFVFGCCAVCMIYAVLCAYHYFMEQDNFVVGTCFNVYAIIMGVGVAGSLVRLIQLAVA